VALSQLHGCAAVVVGGAATGTSVALDRRTAGAYVGDQEIELRAMNRLSESFKEKPVRISVTSYNRQALLTGQVPDEATRARAAEVVKAVPEVRAVLNELAITDVVSLTTQTNDATTTANIKTRLLRDERVSANNIKVVTEAGVAYLMGLVTAAEASAATEVTRNTAGVTKVVTVFEFIN
jgi:osmotically-inducible protein OsmY